MNGRSPLLLARPAPPAVRAAGFGQLGAALALLAGVAGTVLGCGDRVELPMGNGQGAGGQGGQGGSGEGGGGQGGAGECDVPAAALSFAIVTGDGAVHDCTDPDGEITLEGRVIAGSTPDRWMIDTCSPVADCPQIIATIEVSSGGPLLAIPEGTLVRVQATFANYGGICASSLLITNMPDWYGEVNPVATDAAPWLDANGSADSPFQLDPVEQCHVGDGTNECGQTFYKLRFQLRDDPSVATEPVKIGAAATWQVPSGPAEGSYVVRNLGADSGYCEIPGNTFSSVSRAP